MFDPWTASDGALDVRLKQRLNLFCNVFPPLIVVQACPHLLFSQSLGHLFVFGQFFLILRIAPRNPLDPNFRECIALVFLSSRLCAYPFMHQLPFFQCKSGPSFLKPLDLSQI
jgi:hypothetical protein